MIVGDSGSLTRLGFEPEQAFFADCGVPVRGVGDAYERDDRTPSVAQRAL
jgi:hypothetical protein